MLCSKTRHQGFTLLELMIVVVVIGLIAAFVLSRFGNVKEKTYVDAMKNDLRNLASSQEIYFTENSTYADPPTSIDGVGLTEDVFVANSKANGESWETLLGHKQTDETCLLAVGQKFGNQSGVINCTTSSLLTIDADNTNPDPGEEVTFNGEQTLAFGSSGVSSTVLAGPAVPSLSFSETGALDGELSDVSTLYWDFGDGTTTSGPPSSHSVVAHSYSEANTTYGVTLRAEKLTGEQVRAATTIATTGAALNSSPSATILVPSSDTTINEGAILTLEGEGSDPEDGDLSGSQLSWSSSQDGGLGTGSSLSVSSLSEGDHTIELVATDSEGATGSDTRLVSVNSAPEASFTTNCTDLDCNFTDTSTDSNDSIASWSWDFGDGGQSTAQDPNHTYSSGGTYTVQLTVTDDQGATGSTSQDVTVEEPAPQNGPILFEMNGDLYTVNPDGSDQQQIFLDPDPGIVEAGTWSPDGSQIVVDINNEIWIYNSDGASGQQLTTQGQYPAWSPEGDRIAFMSARDGSKDIYTMNTDGSNVVQITDHSAGDFRPTWSPDGTRIAFRSQRNSNNDIWIVDADGNNLQQVTTHSSVDIFPEWSPDGSEIIFESRRTGADEIWAISTDGSNPRQITTGGTFASHPDWSPDNTQVVYSNNGNIWTSNVDGSNHQEILQTSDPPSALNWGPQ